MALTYEEHLARMLVTGSRLNERNRREIELTCIECSIRLVVNGFTIGKILDVAEHHIKEMDTAEQSPFEDQKATTTD